MLYRRFGKTELSMPVITLGGMRFQYQWEDTPLERIPPENQANVEAVVERAFELGINHFETARGYGSSERQLGRALASLPRSEIIVQTKIRPHRKPHRFVRDFLDSLSRLNLSYVDLLAVHGINNRKELGWVLRPCGCLRAARRLKRKGLIRFLGFSTHGPPDVIIAAIRSGAFDYVNLHWYYFYQQNRPAVEEAARRDMGVFIISPSDKGGMLYKPPGKLLELCRPLHPMEFNDLFCLSRPEVHTISVGAAKPEDLDLHVEIVKRLPEAPGLLPPIEARLKKAMEEAVGADFAARYLEGLPSWEETPGGINIPVILWLWTLAKAYDMVEYARMRYELLGKGETWFPGAQASNLDELDLRPVLQRSPFAERIPHILREAHLWFAPEEKEEKAGGIQSKKKNG